MFKESLLTGTGLRAPLLDQAWVFQEVMLARRSLHSELIWECRTLHACECKSIDFLRREFLGLVRA